MRTSLQVLKIVISLALLLLLNNKYSYGQPDIEGYIPSIFKSPDGVGSNNWAKDYSLLADSRMRPGYPVGKIVVDIDEYLFYGLREVKNFSFLSRQDFLYQVEVIATYKGGVYKGVIDLGTDSSSTVKSEIFGFQIREILTRKDLTLNGDKNKPFPVTELTSRNIQDLDVTLNFIWKSKVDLPEYKKYIRTKTNHEANLKQKALNIKNTTQPIALTLNSATTNIAIQIFNFTSKGKVNRAKLNEISTLSNLCTKYIMKADDALSVIEKEAIPLFSSNYLDKQKEIEEAISDKFKILRKLEVELTDRLTLIDQYVNKNKSNKNLDIPIFKLDSLKNVNLNLTKLFKRIYKDSANLVSIYKDLKVKETNISNPIINLRDDSMRVSDAYTFQVSKFGLVALIDFSPISVASDNGKFADAISGLFKNLSKTSVDYAYISRRNSLNNLLITVPIIKLNDRSNFTRNFEFEGMYAINNVNQEQNTGWGFGVGLLGKKDKAIKLGMVFFENDRNPNLYVGLSLRGIFGFLAGINEL